MNGVPHAIPYQGSKRALASRILEQVRYADTDTLYEPFAGSSAVTLAAASRGLAKWYVIGEKLEPLARLWEMIISDPEAVAGEYETLWRSQLHDPKEYFFRVRDEFNLSKSPPALLFLIARCVKNSIRFNPQGQFNQSADNRRLGMRPEKMRVELKAVSKVLRGRTRVVCADFRETLRDAGRRDLVYLDPPWQGLGRNPRYAYLLDAEGLFGELGRLNSLDVPFLLSYDGSCGARSYVGTIPRSLRLRRVALEAGRSSQATLLGRDEVTVESLYLSPALRDRNGQKPARAKVRLARQIEMFD